MILLQDTFSVRSYLATFDSPQELEEWSAKAPLARIVAKALVTKSKPREVTVLINEYTSRDALNQAIAHAAKADDKARQNYQSLMRRENAATQARWRTRQLQKTSADDLI